MAGQVVVRTVGDAFQFLDAEGEFVFQVIGFFGVEGAFVIRYVQNVDVFTGNPHFVIETETLFQPFVHQPQAVFRTAEVFDFHLLEFTGAEGEVARIDFIAERFADLSDPERQFHAGTVQNVFVLAEDGLSRFRPQPSGGVGIVFIGGGPNGRFEHEVEFAGFRQQGTVGGVVHGGVRDGFHTLSLELDFLVGYVLAGQLRVVLGRGFAGLVRLFFSFHQHGVFLFHAPGTVLFRGSRVEEPHAALGRHLVGAQAFLGQQAVAHRIGEAAHVAGGHHAALFDRVIEHCERRELWVRMEPSIPTTSSRSWTVLRHQYSLRLRLSSTPMGP